MKCKVCNWREAKVGSSCFECLRRVETSADTIKRLTQERDDAARCLDIARDMLGEQAKSYDAAIDRINAEAQGSALDSHSEAISRLCRIRAICGEEIAGRDEYED